MACKPGCVKLMKVRVIVSDDFGPKQFGSLYNELCGAGALKRTCPFLPEMWSYCLLDFEKSYVCIYVEGLLTTKDQCLYLITHTDNIHD